VQNEPSRFVRNIVSGYVTWDYLRYWVGSVDVWPKYDEAAPNWGYVGIDQI